MSNKNIQQEQDELQNVEQALSKTEQFIENNRKQLLIGLGVVVVIAAAFVWFFNGYVAPKNVEAADKMAAAVPIALRSASSTPLPKYFFA